ncbi:S-adenosyl-L-methionine-dependent methyltransferase [Ceraceosorus guamensis]|uniref:S-adenosyl-L-methionine-dependent methyltransferase n=1 Tax=Ceraceosorus guamensis TaxID=1522189 RepID=A0A316W993_9BASI|nr:S-adenosyl-L-methionine-dependent methyltransferase [Ceraceosorus guamensis]PWN45331.1 S-adenosyl-L-methionine-dependent methyltransferase [Ceraceosorus guamensis]
MSDSIAKPQAAILALSALSLAGSMLFLLRNPPPTPFADRLSKLDPKETSIDNDFYDDYFESSAEESNGDGDDGGVVDASAEKEEEHPLQLVNYGRIPYFLRTWTAQSPLCAQVKADVETMGGATTRTVLPASFKALDVGCGGGIAAEVVARAGAQVTGVDLSAGAIACAKRRAKARGLSIEYVVGDALDLPVPSETYDGVLCSDTLEHLFDLDAALKEMARVLKPGGILVLDTINRTRVSWYALVLIAQDTLGYLPHGAHDWRLFITPDELSTSLQRAGLEACPESAVRGMRPGMRAPHIILARTWHYATSKQGSASFLDCFIGRWTETTFTAGSYLAWARKPL